MTQWLRGCFKKILLILEKLYGNVQYVEERHRHRYEVNPEYVEELEKHGLKFVGKFSNSKRYPKLKK